VSHPIPPIALPPAPAITVADAFPAATLDGLQALAQGADDTGTTGGGSTQRRSKVRWVDYDPDLYGKVAEVVANVNAHHWRFELSGIFEQMQLAKYEAANNAIYDWHQDFGASISSRKLSLTLQLSDAESYAGGDLQIFKAAGEVLNAPRVRGTVIIFPAYQLHRVTPVTKGVRHSLVAWIGGPAFR
jgi:PKHD-type hydroxylase